MDVMILGKLSGFIKQITKQAKLYKDKNILREYVLESFKNTADFTASSCTPIQDTTNFKTGTSALSVSTTVAGTLGSVIKNVTWNLSSATTFELECFIADNSKITAINIFFMTSGTAYYNEVKAGFINGWNQFRWDKLDMGITGSPSWSNITQFKIEVTPVSGQNVTIIFDSLKKDRFDQPKMVFCFDDGLSSVYDIAYPILASKEYKGCACVYKSAVDVTAHVTTPQLKEMYNAGWDILNHSSTHPAFGSMTYNDVAKEIQDMRDWLYSNGFFRGLDIIAYPNSYTTIGKQVAKDIGYSVGRDAVTTGYNYGPTGDIFWLKSFLTDSTVAAGSVTTRMNRLLRAGGTMITYCHDVVSSGATGSQTNAAIIQQMVDFCYSNNIKVMTLSEWYADLFN